MELLDKEKLKKMTSVNRKKEAQKIKAKKVAATLALTSVVGAGIAGKVIQNCHANEASKAICPITQIETVLFGYEKGLDHQAADLVRESKQVTENNSKPKIEHVLTIEGKEGYSLPSNNKNEINEPTEVLYTEVIGDKETVKKWTYNTASGDFLNTEDLTAEEETVYKLLKTK